MSADMIIDIALIIISFALACSGSSVYCQAGSQVIPALGVYETFAAWVGMVGIAVCIALWVSAKISRCPWYMIYQGLKVKQPGIKILARI